MINIYTQKSLDFRLLSPVIHLLKMTSVAICIPYNEEYYALELIPLAGCAMFHFCAGARTGRKEQLDVQ